MEWKVFRIICFILMMKSVALGRDGFGIIVFLFSCRAVNTSEVWNETRIDRELFI